MAFPAVCGLVLHGAEDLITMPRHNERVAAAIPGAELRAVDGAGHMAFAERPNECNAAIRAFLEKRLDMPQPA